MKCYVYAKFTSAASIYLHNLSAMPYRPKSAISYQFLLRVFHFLAVPLQFRIAVTNALYFSSCSNLLQLSDLS